MLEITVPAQEFYDEQKEEFVTIDERKLTLEHSLISLSKWESKWQKPFLADTEKTTEETLDYIRFMTITKNVPPEVYLALSEDNLRDIEHHIRAQMTATTFNERGPASRGRSEKVITSELIYYWMISSNIPVEFEKWHLSRLLTLIRVCSVKNAPPKKMSKSQALAQQRQLNAARRAQLGTTG